MNLDEIVKLKEEKDIVVLAHYYVDGEVQKVADYVGDSYYLSKLATTVSQKNIVFCGVSFMGESAKILSPEKRVFMADKNADCPMAHMVDIETICQVRENNPDVAVVCYVNSAASIKAYADVCVTSSNAIRVVEKLEAKNIFFIPDNNLGRYVAKKVPSKNFIFHDGFCHVHTSISKENVLLAKELHPTAKVLSHPECTWDVLEISDFIGSTSEILDYAKESKDEVFIICTEMGIFYELQLVNPNKKFYSVGHRQFCPNMKLITLDKLYDTMLTFDNEVILPDDLMEKARIPLEKMLELAK